MMLKAKASISIAATAWTLAMIAHISADGSRGLDRRLQATLARHGFTGRIESTLETVLVAMLTGFVQIGGRVLEACGAKFIVATKSPRFPRAQRATRPATILLYQHASDPDVIEFIVELRNMLNGVGHKVTVVTSEAALLEVAGRQKFNVVMMQLDAARRLRNDLASSSHGAAILPMKEFVPGAEAARVKEEFGQMLKLPTTDRDVLSVVRDAHR